MFGPHTDLDCKYIFLLGTSIVVFSHHILQCFNPLPNDKFQTLPNLKNLQTTIFEFDEYGKKFSEWVENIVEKGEVARNEQFLVFP